MLAVSSVFIKLAGAKLNTDRLKNVFKESLILEVVILPADWRRRVRISKIEISRNLSASSLCVLKSGEAQPGLSHIKYLAKVPGIFLYLV